MKIQKVWLLVFVLAFVFYAACDSDDDDDDNDNDDNNDDVVDDDTTADDDSADDDANPPDEPEHFDIHIVYGYPALLEKHFTEMFLENTGFVRDGEVWTFADAYGDRTYSVRQGWTAEALVTALTTEDAFVIFAGHSNFGFGATFTDNPWASELMNITGIDDIFNIASEHVAVQYRYFIEHQAYPNFVIQTEQIAVHPLNYLTESLGLERFENIDGIEPGMNFPDVQGEGLDLFHFRAPEPDPMYPLDELLIRLLGLNMELDDRMLIANGGAADLPAGLKYKVLLYKSCYSGLYFLDNLQRGVVFYTTKSPSVFRPTIWIFLTGLIKGSSWATIKNAMNDIDEVYDFYIFDEAKRSTQSVEDPLTVPADLRRQFISAMVPTANEMTIGDWLNLLAQPRTAIMCCGSVIDNGGQILAARWALGGLGEPALTALLDELDLAPAFYKANLLYALAEFDDVRARVALRVSLHDTREVVTVTTPHPGRPLRIADIAYNILAQQMGDAELINPLSVYDPPSLRDLCLRELQERL